MKDANLQYMIKDNRRMTDCFKPRNKHFRIEETSSRGWKKAANSGTIQSVGTPKRKTPNLLTGERFISISVSADGGPRSWV